MPGAAAPQPPIVDLDHVLGPGTGREATALLEAGQPVLRVPFTNHQKRGLHLPDGERAVHLRAVWGVLVHG